MFIWKLFGIIGLLILTVGIFLKNKEKEELVFAIGGLFLLSYSVSIRDPIFIVLQIVFIISAIFNLIRLHFFQKRKKVVRKTKKRKTKKKSTKRKK